MLEVEGTAVRGRLPRTVMFCKDSIGQEVAQAFGVLQVAPYGWSRIFAFQETRRRKTGL